MITADKFEDIDWLLGAADLTAVQPAKQRKLGRISL
jgi:hypothetical protein